MELEKRETYPVNCIRICMDGYSDQECRGRLCGVALQDEIRFETMHELIIQVDEAFNQIGQPQSSQILRNFHEKEQVGSYVGQPKRYHGSSEIAQKRGIKGTVDLIMTSRHCTEWQGMLSDIGGEHIGAFASVLECIDLLGTFITES